MVAPHPATSTRVSIPPKLPLIINLGHDDALDVDQGDDQDDDQDDHNDHDDDHDDDDDHDHGDHDHDDQSGP